MTIRRHRQYPTQGTVRQFVVDGLRTRVEVRGEGPPLLLIMGLWGEISAWDPLIDELAGFQTIAFDAPGIGGTDLPSFPRSLPALARFAVGVLDAVGLARAHVLGVSFGGLVAQQLAVILPDRVDRLVLVSTSSGFMSVPGQPQALLRLFAPWSFTTRDGLADAGDVFGGRIRKHPELLAQLGLRGPDGLSLYVNRLAGLSGWWGLPWSIRQPALVLTGDDDPLVPPSNSRILANFLPNARLKVISGGGHLVLFDSPAEVAPLIGGFLREGRRRSVGTLVS
jgi:pimeloyl-ACP methyl ester carboxylesterase